MTPSMFSRLCRAYPYTRSVPRSTTRHNRRAWLKSLRFLGDKWLLAPTAYK